MRKLFDVLRTDLKMMGPNAFVPAGLALFYVGLLFVYTALGDLEYRIVVRLGEFLLPIFAAWWPVFLLVPIVETAGCEVFYSYPTRTVFYGLIRVAALFALYEAILAVTYGVIAAAFHMTVKQLFLQTSLQSLFFCAFGYALVVLTKNSSISFVIIVAYDVAFQLGGKMMPSWFNVYLWNEMPVSAGELAGSVLPVSACWSAAFAILAHLRLNSLRSE